MYLSERYSINPLETLHLGCGQFGYPELRYYKLLHCPWTVFLFIYLIIYVVMNVNFFFKMLLLSPTVNDMILFEITSDNHP